MSVGHHYTNALANNLTQLYTETKKSALSNVQRDDKTDSVPALVSLHRKFRIQKDRLITWGIEWSDEGKGPNGNIDESVARAGLTETVTSVLENIKEVLEQAERVRSDTLPQSGAWPSFAAEKAAGMVRDLAKYRDLVTDLTTSIDILYDLSRTRRALVSGSHPSFSAEKTKMEKSVSSLATSGLGGSEVTLVNSAIKSTRYTDAPAKIDVSALILPEEGPPPYQNSGAPLTTRLIGRLLRSQAPDEIRYFLHESLDDPLVLIEYANAAATTQTGVPVDRLIALGGYLQQAQSHSALNLLGYFEDPHTARLGLVYDIRECVLRSTPGADFGTGPVEAFSLSHALQEASKNAKTQDTLSATPPLEERFRLAAGVSEIAREMHNTYFAHGCISGDSVIFVQGGVDGATPRIRLQDPVLSAFEVHVRHTDDDLAESTINIYRHPSDSASTLDIRSRIRYEMYGIGLVLLEIGLWTPLGDLYKAKYQLKDFKTRLERIWIPRLAVKCGSLYMSAVQECFRFSDDAIDDPAEAIQLYDGILSKLRRCCLLCDSTAAEPISPQVPISKASSRKVPQESGTMTGRSSAALARAEPQSMSPWPFRDYRRKVVLLQQCWRTIMASRRKHSATIAPKTTTTSSQEVTPEFFSRAAKQRTFPVQLPPPVLAQWHSELGLNLSRIVERALKNSLESATIDLVGLGTDEESARPTVLVTCTSTARVKAAIKKCFVCDTSMFDVKVRKGAVALSRGGDHSALRRSSARDQRSNRTAASIALDEQDHEEIVAKNPFYHPRPSCGASIGAYNADEGHLLPVSFGGYVTVDGESFGMSVHHMLEPGSDEEDDGQDASDDADDEIQDASEDDGCYSSVNALSEIGSDTDSDLSLPDLTRRRDTLSRSSARVHTVGQHPSKRRRQKRHAAEVDDELYTSSSDVDFSTSARSSPRSSLTGRSRADPDLTTSQSGSSEDDDEDLPSPTSPLPPGPVFTPGDTRSFPPSHPSTTQWTITQPALHDAVRTGWHPSASDSDNEFDQLDLDADHTASFALGSLACSSGLRRWRDSVGRLHEVDWALFRTNPPRTQTCNLILGGAPHCSKPDDPSPSLADPTPQHRATPAEPVLRTKAQLLDPTTNGGIPPYGSSASFCISNDLFPCGLVPETSFPGARILGSGRTSGLATSGTIGPAMSLVKFFGRRDFSISWTVVGGRFGVGGDSGAWVIDRRDARVAGVVLAERGGVCYFCPMGLVLEDVKRVMGAEEVRLLGDRSNQQEEIGPSALRQMGTEGVATPVQPAGRGVEQDPVPKPGMTIRIKDAATRSAVKPLVRTRVIGTQRAGSGHGQALVI